MRCPFCSESDNKVIDSRLSRDENVIRRRRECERCQRRFTTYERIEEILPLVVKKDGRREPFDRKKIMLGIQKACEKRPVSVDTTEQVVEKLEKRFQESGVKEIPSSGVGEAVMQELHDLDQVAYVRFASVYRSFKDLNEFMAELKELLDEEKKKSAAKG
ncbi:MAG: transcriptional regulator NrdR [Deltaproteobacteria bacterium RBG_13_65_10]|nr:MAG: transcriptional regulator NrdR [Deltaproteobacteria bacterium RBG_13_65_10]